MNSSTLRTAITFLTDYYRKNLNIISIHVTIAIHKMNMTNVNPQLFICNTESYNLKLVCLYINGIQKKGVVLYL